MSDAKWDYGIHPVPPITNKTVRVLRCPSCGNEFNGDDGHAAACARCITGEGYFTPMVAYVKAGNDQ